MKLFIQQWMMSYLRKRGWVVFYLEKEHRTCSNTTCFLNLYDAILEDEEKAKTISKEK